MASWLVGRQNMAGLNIYLNCKYVLLIGFVMVTHSLYIVQTSDANDLIINFFNYVG